MEKIYDQMLVEEYLKQTSYEESIGSLKEKMWIAEYEKGEFISSPFESEHLFQIIIQGGLHIYCIRDDGSVHSLSSGQHNYILGDMEVFSNEKSAVYAEADTNLISLAFSIDENREQLLNNPSFLRLICKSLTWKIEMLTTFDATPVSLNQRVLTYIRYRCVGGELRGLEQASSHLNCSSRQLQRILNKYEEDGVVTKIGKGSYKLSSDIS